MIYPLVDGCLSAEDVDVFMSQRVRKHTILSYKSHMARDSSFIRYGFVALLVVLPFYAFPPLNIGTRPIQWDWLVAAIIIIGFVLTIVTRNTGFILRLDMISTILILLNSVLVFSLIVPLFRGNSYIIDFLTTWALFLLGSSIFIAITQTKFSRNTIRLILRLYVGMALLVALFGIAQFVLANVVGSQILFIEPTSVSYVSSTGYESRLGFLRPNSIFAEPRHFGNFLLTPLFASLVAIHPDVKIFEKRAGFLIALVLLVAIVLSFSASTYLGLLVSILVLPLVLPRDKAGIMRMYATLSLLIVVVFPIILLIIDSENILYTLERLSISPEKARYVLTGDINTLSQHSGTGRYLGGMVGAFMYAAKYPLTGVGLNQFYSYYPDLWILPPFRFLMESGLVATVLFAIFYLSLFRNILRLKRYEQDPQNYRLLQIAAVFLIVLVLKFSMASNYGYASTWFWTDLTLAGLIFYTCQRSWVGYKGRRSGLQTV